MKKDLYQTVTNRILSELEKGCVPWVKPWAATAGANQPCNADTGRPYSGVNIILIWQAMASNPQWTTPRFLTFKQCQALGGHVKKDEHGIQVYFVKPLLVKGKKEQPAGDEELKRITMLREFTVFNVAQCDNLPARCLGTVAPKIRNKDSRDSTVDSFIATLGSDLRHGEDRAYYASSHDFVMLPNFQDFKGADHYYATSFHEHGHWTGAEKRLNREFGKRFGDKAYAAEELVAELTAAFLCAEFGIDGDLRHAAYVSNWIAILKSDSKAFFTAASAAQKAADYMRGLALAEPLAVAA
jgi:antirestriction protein ArdC